MIYKSVIHRLSFIFWIVLNSIEVEHKTKSSVSYKGTDKSS